MLSLAKRGALAGRPSAGEELKMLRQKHLDDRVERTVLFIGDDASRRGIICNFLASKRCRCISASASESPGLVLHGHFDAVLLHAQSAEWAHQAILALSQARPGMTERILVIAGPDLLVPDYLGAQIVSQDLPLPQLWSRLENIFRDQQICVPAGMQIAQLVYDSLCSPRRDGIRGLQRGARQLAFQHHGTTVNVLTNHLENVRLLMIGQVLDLSMRRVHGLPVLLRRRSTTLAQTTTSQFGEFRFESELLDNAGLEIRLAEGSWIHLSLNNLGKSES